MEIYKTFSKKDLVELLEINNQAISISSEEELEDNILRVQNLIPFEYAYCGLGNLLQGSGKAVEILNTKGFHDRFFSQNFNQFDPVLLEFYKTTEIQVWETLHKKHQIKDVISFEQDEFGTNNGLTCGLVDFDKIYSAAFSFVGKEMKIDKRTKAVFETVVPYIVLGIERFEKTDRKKKAIGKLTAKEIEVLKWLKDGKTTYETSKILHISERTVNFHISNIKIKLNAVNRVQAVAIALENRIIDW